MPGLADQKDAEFRQGRGRRRPVTRLSDSVVGHRDGDGAAAVDAGLLAELGRDPSGARAIGAGIEALTDGLWLQMYLASGITESSEARDICAMFLTAIFPERAAVFAGEAG